MRTRHILVASLLMAAPGYAQSPLSLPEAIARATAHNPDAGSAEAAEREAAERVAQARGGYLPKIDVAESWQRGNNPVFVFSSRLAQRRFTAADHRHRRACARQRRSDRAADAAAAAGDECVPACERHDLRSTSVRSGKRTRNRAAEKYFKLKISKLQACRQAILGIK